IPYLMPAVVSGALMAFSLSLDELIVTYFTASAGSRTLPLEIFGRVKKGLDPTLNAISTVFILLTVVLAVAAELLRRQSSPHSAKLEEATWNVLLFLLSRWRSRCSRAVLCGHSRPIRTSRGPQRLRQTKLLPQPLPS